MTKVDVRAAFHKLRVREGDEEKTAFRTRFGSFEWLVTPFGLQGAPAAFQRYVNETLGNYLDVFCTAYLDDILIYTNGDRQDHWEKVNAVFERLNKAGLRLDPKKCEFGVKETKYLGFIINLGQGIKVDPEKIEAIKSWEAPISVKGVGSFLGFANFYREFISHFSKLTQPLFDLTKKDHPFLWLEKHDKYFQALKELFVTAPILALYDPNHKTVVEADCSGFVMGACLSQVDHTKSLRPIAYFSRKQTPAECNYEIHDKELLAVISALEEWRGELIGFKNTFIGLSDHKNLQHFMTSRKLSERQVRWSHTLSQFDFQLNFRAGKNSARLDALSRRGQDKPKNTNDDRLKSREFRLIKDAWIEKPIDKAQEISHITSAIMCSTQTEQTKTNVNIPSGNEIFQDENLQKLWNQGCSKDQDFSLLYKGLKNNDRIFPTTLNIKVSISECDFDERGALRFRKRVWIPNWEPLQTALIQKTHISYITGHPGRDSTYAILSRNFFGHELLQWCECFAKIVMFVATLMYGEKRKKDYNSPYQFPIVFIQNYP